MIQNYSEFQGASNVNICHYEILEYWNTCAADLLHLKTEKFVRSYFGGYGNSATNQIQIGTQNWEWQISNLVHAIEGTVDALLTVPVTILYQMNWIPTLVSTSTFCTALDTKFRRVIEISVYKAEVNFLVDLVLGMLGGQLQKY